MKQNTLGFFEVYPRPSKEELASHYEKHYFNGINFEVTYSDEERFHKQVPYMEAEFVFSQAASGSKEKSGLRFLDVGCGEGFSLNYFSKKNWDVYGTDYADMAIKRHFPELLKNVTIGDTESTLAEMVKNEKKFDLINLNNVLEHLMDPVTVMSSLQKLLNPGGCLRVQVPNDFSPLQKLLLEKKIIDREFWVAPLEHLNYFEKNSLQNLFAHVGFTKLEVLADYPIDLNLLNPDTNYVMDKSKGKNCHIARMTADNFLARKSVEDLVNFRKGCGKSGLGRNVIVYGWV